MSYLGRTKFHHHCTKEKTLVPTRCFVSKLERLKEEWCVENRGQILHFLTPVKIRGGVGKNAEREDRVYRTTNLWRLLRRV